MARDRDALTTSTLARWHAWGSSRAPACRAESRWPQIDFGLTWAIFEPGSGVILARRAVATLVRDAERQGVAIPAAVRRPTGGGDARRRATQTGRRSVPTSCLRVRPWLPNSFRLLQDRSCRRGRKCCIDPSAGDRRFAPPALPAWIDFGEEIYGIPDLEGQGFKIAVDGALDGGRPRGGRDGHRRSATISGGASRTCVTRRSSPRGLGYARTPATATS